MMDLQLRVGARAMKVSAASMPTIGDAETCKKEITELRA